MVESVALIQAAVYAVSVEYTVPGNTTQSVVQMVEPTTIRVSWEPLDVNFRGILHDSTSGSAVRHAKST